VIRCLCTLDLRCIWPLRARKTYRLDGEHAAAFGPGPQRRRVAENTWSVTPRERCPYPSWASSVYNPASVTYIPASQTARTERYEAAECHPTRAPAVFWAPTTDQKTCLASCSWPVIDVRRSTQNRLRRHSVAGVVRTRSSTSLAAFRTTVTSPCSAPDVSSPEVASPGRKRPNRIVVRPEHTGNGTHDLADTDVDRW